MQRNWRENDLQGRLCPRRLWLVAFLALGLPAGAAAQTAIEGEITSVGQTFGNLNTSIPVSRLELEAGSPFRFRCKGGESIRALYVGFYTDVPTGEWLGLPNEESQLQLAINSGHADSVSGCGVGDPVSISTGAPQQTPR